MERVCVEVFALQQASLSIDFRAGSRGLARSHVRRVTRAGLAGTPPWAAMGPAERPENISATLHSLPVQSPAKAYVCAGKPAEQRCLTYPVRGDEK